MGRPTLQRTYGVSGITGTVAAALAQDSLVFAMFCDPTQAALWAYIDQLRLAFTTIAAFTAPITAGRRLGVYRAAAVAATGGAGLNVVKKQTGAPTSIISSVRIATVGALTAGALVREADPLFTLDLVSSGAAGARAEAVYEFNPESWNPPGPILEPGESLVVSNPAAMDAGGTWQLAVTAHWREEIARA
jgi:hypothetical protein